MLFTGSEIGALGMNMHKKLRLTTLDRKEIWKRYQDAKLGNCKFAQTEEGRYVTLYYWLLFLLE
jgi:hypothetical protein